MRPTKKIARLAGFFYFLLIPFGVFGILYIPMQFVAPGDMAATIRNITDDIFTFRLSIVCALVTQIIQIFTVLALYQLLNSVHKQAAQFMVISILVAVPIAMLNEVNHLAVLESLGDAKQVSLFLNLHKYGVNIAQIFWGIWLFPMGYLVYKSGFIPKMIGVLLYIACFGYLADSFIYFLDINLGFAFSEFTFFGEIAIVLWLLIKGIKTT
ncbi:DUF4386 domain-containing protein [Crocinitomix catalasitica]|uniref:DUF4386 domain-containing protein n=1 Tax=Crocinitomix catalasitica TaxID=184607 RepID=UPI000686CB1B|nr:DUF4386 domain-containing protein [Crocinitomix catalasitica]